MLTHLVGLARQPGAEVDRVDARRAQPRHVGPGLLRGRPGTGERQEALQEGVVAAHPAGGRAVDDLHVGATGHQLAKFEAEKRAGQVAALLDAASREGRLTPAKREELMKGYAADDQTVAKAAGASLPVAGTVIGVEPDGVWVQMNLDGRS